MVLKTNTTIGRTLRVALLATTVGLGATTWSAPAFAQNDQATKASEETESKAIVVTGSRIKRADYTSNSPTDHGRSGVPPAVLDRPPSNSSSTSCRSSLSQSSTVKNNDGVLTAAGGDIQPNATNTPGASTVSLRGVGANRSLVLIDGRRGTPGNATGTVDVSTIPAPRWSASRVISGGASATYGADAVAGVTNFILKKNFRRPRARRRRSGMSQSGNGLEYQVSGIMGADFPDGRGNVSLAMSLNTRELMLQKDNTFFRDLWANPNTTGGAVLRPASGHQRPDSRRLASMPRRRLHPRREPTVRADQYVPRRQSAGSQQYGQRLPQSRTARSSRALQAALRERFRRTGGARFFKPWSARRRDRRCLEQDVRSERSSPSTA